MKKHSQKSTGLKVIMESVHGTRNLLTYRRAGKVCRDREVSTFAKIGKPGNRCRTGRQSSVLMTTIVSSWREFSNGQSER